MSTDDTAPETTATTSTVPGGTDETGPTSTAPAPPEPVPSPTATSVVTRGSRLEDHGIRVAVPAGWEGEIYRREADTVSFDERTPVSRQAQPTTRSVVHIGSFPLPGDRGDYGSGAVEIMRDEDVLVILFEFEPESAAEPMFSHDGIPYPIQPRDFDPNQMQRPLAGMAGVQRFFHVGDRAFCLFVVIGSFAQRIALTDKVNAVLAQVELT